MEINVNRYKELLRWENQRQNLISRRSFAQELNKHVEDSLKLLEFMPLEGENLVDIGSGAGFPGILLAIACPAAKVTLVESDQKKSGFLKEVKEQLELHNVEIINKRVEEIGQDSRWRESFSLCSSRAVAAMNIMLEYGLPLLELKGRLLLWKGRNFEQEIEQSGQALALLGGKVEEIWRYTLMGERERVIIAIRKNQLTPEKYPRRAGIPAKRPL